MIRKTFFCSVVFALVACDVTQELQGPSTGADGGTQPTADGGATQPVRDGGPSPGSDASALDGAIDRQTSICKPQSAIGTTAVAVTGNESVYLRNVTDLAAGAGRMFALSEPWTFIGAPLNGTGPSVGYDVSATLPNFIALAIAPTDTNPGGAISSLALASYNLPTGGGQIVALRGSAAGSAIEVNGRVIVDNDDVFYFKKQAPSQLVHAGTKNNPSEQLLVEYPSASNTVVTAAAVIGTYVYFTSIVKGPTGMTGSMLHRVPRTGGTVEDLVSTQSHGLIGDIYQDGNSLYLTPGSTDSAVTSFGIYSLTNGTLASGSLSGVSGNDAYARRSGVAYDGNAFYYGSDSGGGSGCHGKLIRITKAVAVQHAFGNADVLATNLDLPSRVLAAAGAVYVGTLGDPFYKPNGYPGQMLRWTP